MQWTGKDQDPGLWSNPKNWDPQAVPAEGDDVVIGLNAQNLRSAVDASGGKIKVRNLTVLAGAELDDFDLTVTQTFNWESGKGEESKLLDCTVNIPESASLNISGDGDKTAGGGSIQNKGIVTWTGAGKINFADIEFNNAGVFRILNDSTMYWYASGSARVRNPKNGRLVKAESGGITTFDGVVLETSGEVTIEAGSLLLSAINSVAGDPHVLNDGATLKGKGRIRLQAPPGMGPALKVDGGIRIEESTTFELASGGFLSGKGTFSGPGTFCWTGGIIANANLTIQKGTTLAISGDDDKTLHNGAPTINNFGTTTWSGKGKVTGGGGHFNNAGTLNATAAIMELNLSTSGIIELGSPPGSLSIDIHGDYAQTKEGELRIHIENRASGEFDQCVITGRAELAGTLKVSSTKGFKPAGDDRFKIMTYTERSGQFSKIDRLDLLPDGFLIPLYDDTEFPLALYLVVLHRPEDPQAQMLAGVIYAEASPNTKKDDERIAIGSVFLNRVEHTQQLCSGAICIPELGAPDSPKRKNQCRIEKRDLGDNLEAAIRIGSAAYNDPNAKPLRWDKVMDDFKMKPVEQLSKINPLEYVPLWRAVSVAEKLVKGDLQKKPNLIAMNQAGNNPPSTRMEYADNIEKHTFYQFIKGKECG